MSQQITKAEPRDDRGNDDRPIKCHQYPRFDNHQTAFLHRNVTRDARECLPSQPSTQADQSEMSKKISEPNRVRSHAEPGRVVATQ